LTPVHLAVRTSRPAHLGLSWTLPAILFPRAEPLVGPILTWQAQAPSSSASGVTAALPALGGLTAYAAFGPVRQAPAQAGRQ
jgi:hypothetical protein